MRYEAERRLWPRATNPRYITRIKCRLLLAGVEPDEVTLRDVVLAMADEEADLAEQAAGRARIRS